MIGKAAAGENRVQLVFSKGAAASVEWIQLGGTAAADAAPPLHDAKSGALLIADTFNSRVVRVPSGATATPTTLSLTGLTYPEGVAVDSAGDIFVGDAFGSAHRAHASTVGAAERMGVAAAGLLL